MQSKWRFGAWAILASLVVAYLVPGLVGHQPWKPDEPYTFGVVRAMLRSHDWIVPMVGDLPFVEKPPLYYWVASLATHALVSLPPHDAARFATAIFVLVTLWATALAAHLAWGEDAAPLAVLLLLATLGLEGHAQRLQVDHALMAGFAIAVLGLVALTRDRWWAGIALGAGAAFGFLAKGLLAPGAIGLTALLLPLFFRPWRTRRYAEQLAYAALVAVPLMLPWPLALWRRDHALFDAWLWDNNIGRFAGYSTGKLGGTSEPGFWPRTLPWFLFPLWVYAIGALWREGRDAWKAPGMQVGLTVTLVLGMVLLTSASGRAVYALPLLPPMVLMSAGFARVPEGRVARALAIAAIALAVVVAPAIWGVWASLHWTGEVPAWTRLREHFPVPFALDARPSLVAAGGVLTAGFIALVAFRRRLPRPALTLWVGMLSLSWGLAMTLWLPWLDSAKGYRQVFKEASRHTPADSTCVVTRGLGESERAMVDYYMGLRSRATGPEDECGSILWMGSALTEHHRPSEAEWRSAWSGSRPGETSEKFELFVPRRAVARAR